MISHNLNYELNLSYRELINPLINEHIKLKIFNDCFTYEVGTKCVLTGTIYSLEKYNKALKLTNKKFNNKIIDYTYNRLTNKWEKNVNRCFSCSKKKNKLMVNVISKIENLPKRYKQLEKAHDAEIFCTHSHYFKNNFYSI